MFNKDKPGEFNPRHRIVGAIILVSAAVIILPMILNERKPASDKLGDASTPSPAVTTKTVVAPIPPVGVAAPSMAPPEPLASGQADTKAIPLSANPSINTASVPSVDPLPERPASEARTESPPAPKPVKTAEKPTPGKTARPERQQSKHTGWYVQVGTFSQAENARHLAERLKKQGYNVQLESGIVNKAKIVRVRVGPFERSGQAKNVVGDISNITGIKGVVGHY